MALQAISQRFKAGPTLSEEQRSMHITKRLTLVYALVAGFTSANLSYSLPILQVLADDFGVSQAQIATVPAMAQAGNAVGLLTIIPLADFFPRRKFTLLLLILTAAFWLGMCVSKDFTTFTALTFLSSLFTPVTQILLPLVSELSTNETRALRLSIMSTGPTLGIFIGRVISGIIADHTSWRTVYWVAFALQCLDVLLLLMFMPEYEPLNSTSMIQVLKTYPNILWSLVALYGKHPVLVQTGLLSFSTFFAVSSFWTTITFLLSGPGYNYNSSEIGLMGLIGLVTIFIAPLVGKYLVQPIDNPLLSAAIAKTTSLIGVVLGTFLGTWTLAGPVVEAVLLDVGLVILQIANRVALHPIEPQMRNRVNTAFVSVLYLGQFAGTKAGSVAYNRYGGWIPTGGLSIAVVVLGYVIIGVRGPNEHGWFGWRGGWKTRRT